MADAAHARWRWAPFRREGKARVAEGRLGGEAVRLIKPTTYMNLSGAALRPLLRRPGFDPARHLLVLVDDFALPVGAFRLRARGSAGGHNGLQSVEDVLGSAEYARLRIGVGPLPRGADDWRDFVLAPFARDEMRDLEAVVPLMVEAVECWITEGIEAAMTRYNRKTSAR